MLIMCIHANVCIYLFRRSWFVYRLANKLIALSDLDTTFSCANHNTIKLQNVCTYLNRPCEGARCWPLMPRSSCRSTTSARVKSTREAEAPITRRSRSFILAAPLTLALAATTRRLPLRAPGAAHGGGDRLHLHRPPCTPHSSVTPTPETREVIRVAHTSVLFLSCYHNNWEENTSLARQELVDS